MELFLLLVRFSHFILFIYILYSFFGIHLGENTNQLTVSKELFQRNPLIIFWKLEVIYQFENAKSSSSVYMKKNSPPMNGSCTINPSNGTIISLFHIKCWNWFDEDGIKDYSIYGLFIL